MLIPAVAYIRVSSTKQLDGDGPERQKTGILRFADAQGYSVVAAFIEDVSGTTNTSAREVFEQLLAYCAAHSVRHVLIEKSDRISRDMFVGLAIVGDCAANGLALIDADTNRDIANPKGPYEKFVIQILMAAAELNKNVLVHNTSSARERIRARKGKCEGRKGYAELNPELVAKASSLRQMGMTYKEIACQFNNEGIQTLNGNPWKSGTIHSMLNSARGAGTSVETAVL